MDDEDFKKTQRNIATLLNLRDTEAETMSAVFRYCSKLGVASGGGIAVAMAGVGSISIPVVGAVPGWLVGFVAGWTSGTLVCTMAHRGVVIEGLKQIISTTQRLPVNENQAIAMLRAELSKDRRMTPAG